MSRATTPEGVLEAIYDVSSITPPPEDAADVFRGHPLAVTPSGAAVVFHGVWPVITVAVSVAWRLYV